MGGISKLNIFQIKYLLIIKPIVDMLWNIKWLNYFIMVYALLILIYEYRSLKIIVQKIDVIVFLSLLFICLSFSQEIHEETVKIFIKLLSPFVLYYIGRNMKEEPYILMKYMCTGYFFAFLIDLIMFSLNKGFIYWGHALTFTGLYFFKTDLGVALLWLVLLILIDENWFIKRKLSSLIIVTLSTAMIILSNSRMTLILLLYLFGLAFAYYQEKKTGYLLKFNLKLVLSTLTIVLLGLYLIRFLSNSDLFVNKGFIAFDFDKLSELYSPENLQGRNAIWTYLMNEFNSQGILRKMFGLGLYSYVGGGSYYSGLSSHSIYIGVLYSFGYIGMLLSLVYTICIIQKLNKEKDRRIFYMTLFSMTLLLIYGFSVNTHEFTNYTWNFALLTGIVYNSSYKGI